MVLSPVSVQNGLKSPDMSAVKEQGAAVARAKDGSVRWKNRWTMAKTNIGGRPVIRFTEAGEGIRANFERPVSWTIVSTWSNEGIPRPLDSEATYRDASDRVLLTDKRSFDWSRKHLRVVRTAEGEKPKEEVLQLREDLLMVDGIAGVLRGLDFNSARPLAAHLIGSDLKIYEVRLEVRGRERIQTASGTVETFKVELVPHLGLLDLFRFLYPKTHFWFRVDAPHTWVRYEGLEDGPGSPEIILSSE
jgi:hypothetical protein